jgi:hypothetical protein
MYKIILVRELDERLGLVDLIAAHLSDSRHGRNEYTGQGSTHARMGAPEGALWKSDLGDRSCGEYRQMLRHSDLYVYLFVDFRRRTSAEYNHRMFKTGILAKICYY